MGNKPIMGRASAALSVLLIAGSALGGPPGDGVVLEARMPDAIQSGQELELIVGLRVADGWSASIEGSPGVLIQIDTPDGVELLGDRVTEFGQLARANFLELPWEREVEAGETVVPFSIGGDVASGATLGISAVVYLADADGENWFVRRRVELPISAGASESADSQASASDWGENGTLAVGDEAQAFVLPRADGSEVDLSEHLGKNNVIVTTYRAFW